MTEFTVPLNSNGEAGIQLKTRYHTNDPTGTYQEFELNIEDSVSVAADLTSLDEWQYTGSSSTAPSSDGTNINSGTGYYVQWNGKTSTNDCAFYFTLYSTATYYFKFGLSSSNLNDIPVNIVTGRRELPATFCYINGDYKGDVTKPTSATNYSIVIKDGVPTFNDLTNNVSYTGTESIDDGYYFFIYNQYGNTVLSDLRFEGTIL